MPAGEDNDDDYESIPLLNQSPPVQPSSSIRGYCTNETIMKWVVWGLLITVLLGSFYSAFTHLEHSLHDSNAISRYSATPNNIDHILHNQLVEVLPAKYDIKSLPHEYFAYNFNVVDGPNSHEDVDGHIIPFYASAEEDSFNAQPDEESEAMDGSQGTVISSALLGKSGKDKKSTDKGKKKSKRKTKAKSRDGTIDLSTFRKAMANHPSNPFIVDFPRLLAELSARYPSMSGAIDFSDTSSFTDSKAFRPVTPPPPEEQLPSIGQDIPSAAVDNPVSPRGRKAKTIASSDSDPLQHSDHDLATLDVDLLHAIRFYHLSDLHIDALFNPYQSSMQGVCSSCKLSSRVYGDGAYCPLTLPFTRNLANEKRGYGFGRLRCNPPPQLLASALGFLRSHQPFPAFIIITGDIGNHGMPDDAMDITPDTQLKDLCPTKFIGMRNTLLMFRQFFPKTPILLTLGNNDHFPKNVVWTPFMEALAALLIEVNMLHPSQAQIFTRIASHYVDLSIDNDAYWQLLKSSPSHQEFVDLSTKNRTSVPKDWPKTINIRVILPDLSLFIPGGEISQVDPSEYEQLEGLARENAEFPRRAELLSWLNHTLFEAQQENRYVILAGHQPLALKKSTNELLLQSAHGYILKAVLATYSSIIKLALFGHRNLASIYNILSPDNTPIVPSVVVPGISPRGNNLPALHEVMLRRSDATVLDMEQFIFDIMEENEHAQLLANNIEPPSIDHMYQDSGSAVIHELLASRLKDRYDPIIAKEHAKLHQQIFKNSTTVQEKQSVGGVQESTHQTNAAAHTTNASSISDEVVASKIIATSKGAASNQRDQSTAVAKMPFQLTKEESIRKHGVDCHRDPGLCQLLEPWGYIGRWTRHPEIAASFRKMAGATELTTNSISEMNANIPKSGRLFLSLQVWRAAGIIADQTPENMLCASLYDDETMMMRCLFPEQDDREGCFARTWLR